MAIGLLANIHSPLRVVAYGHLPALILFIFAVQGARYKAIAVGFYDDDVCMAYTTNCTCLITHSVIDYLRSIAIVGMWHLNL